MKPYSVFLAIIVVLSLIWISRMAASSPQTRGQCPPAYVYEQDMDTGKYVCREAVRYVVPVTPEDNSFIYKGNGYKPTMGEPVERAYHDREIYLV